MIQCLRIYIEELDAKIVYVFEEFGVKILYNVDSQLRFIIKSL